MYSIYLMFLHHLKFCFCCFQNIIICMTQCKAIIISFVCANGTKMYITTFDVSYMSCVFHLKNEHSMRIYNISLFAPICASQILDSYVHLLFYS